MVRNACSAFICRFALFVTVGNRFYLFAASVFEPFIKADTRVDRVVLSSFPKMLLCHDGLLMRSVKKIKKISCSSSAMALLIAIGLSGCGKSSDPAALIAEARQYQQKGDTKAAIIQLKNALQKNPDDSEARFALGEIYSETGDALSAEKELRKALSLGISRDRVMPVIGKSLLAQGQFQKVIDETSSGTLSPELLVLRGTAFLGLGKANEAKQVFQQALDQKPDSSLALTGMARYAASVNDMDSASRYIEQAVAKNPSDSEAWLFKGDLSRARGNNDVALKDYDTVLKLQPTNIGARLSHANVNILARKFDDAKADIEAAKKIKPDFPIIFYSQALLNFNQGKNAAALESIQQLLRIAPDYMPAVLLAGAVQFALGSNEQAEQQLKKYLAANPDNLYAKKLFASILLKDGQTDKATEILAEALKEAPQDPQLLMIAGESSMKTKDFSKATEYFEKANAITPQVAVVHTALALSNLHQGDNAKGVAELELAASLDQKSPKAGVLLVMTQLRLKQFDKAMESVKTLEKQQPNDPLVQNLKGGAYLGIKDLPMARASFEKALSLSPTYVPAAENLARLDLNDGHPENAKKRFESILKLDKKNIAAMTALASLALASGNIQESGQWFEKSVAENPEAIGPSLQLGAFYLQTNAKAKAFALAQKLSAANDSNPEVLDFLGQSQAANNDFPAALATFKKLGALKPNSPLPDLRIAAIQVASRNNSEALASLKKALAIQPDNLEAQIALISMEAKAGDFEGASKIVSQIQKQKPGQPVGFVLEGDLLAAQKKPAQALKAYEQAFAIDRNGPLLVKIHNVMRAAGNEKDADVRLTQWLTETPSDNATRLYLAGSYLESGQKKAAIEQYEIALKADSKNPAIMNNLAYAYQTESDPRALELAEKAVKLAPENAGIADTLGWILVEKNDTSRGLPLLQKASGQLPQNEEIRFHLALALTKSGDKTAARKELEQLSASKTFSKAEEAKRLLKAL
jgi:putative PEP-CTERM system TPR-repeat lipoprotein